MPTNFENISDNEKGLCIYYIDTFRLVLLVLALMYELISNKVAIGRHHVIITQGTEVFLKDNVTLLAIIMQQKAH